MNQIELMPGVVFESEHAARFKSSCLSFSLLRPLSREEASKNALLANVLTMATAKHPNLQSMSRALDELYGASVGPMVRKSGRVQTCGIYLSFLEDRFAPEGEPILASMLDFLREILFEPLLEGEGFSRDLISLEKANLINTIHSAINDKRSYADRRLMEIMSGGQGFGVPRLGTVEDVEAITPENLYAHYRRILASSRIRIFYAGSLPGEAVAEMLRKVLCELPRDDAAQLTFEAAPEAGQVRHVEESMELNQSILAMGLTTGVTAESPDYVPMMLLNVLYGGDLTSKLFQNVREKLSLCYTVSSSHSRSTGIMTISAGIKTEDYQKALDEILAQLKACQEGRITEMELEDARIAVLSGLSTVSDSVGQMEGFAALRTLCNFTMEMDAYKAAIRKVTLEDCVRAAQKVKLDTIYFLKGEAQ